MKVACVICGKPVLVSVHAAPNNFLRFHTDDRTGKSVAWHRSCEEPGWPHLR